MEGDENTVTKHAQKTFLEQHIRKCINNQCPLKEWCYRFQITDYDIPVINGYYNEDLRICFSYIANKPIDKETDS